MNLAAMKMPVHDEELFVLLLFDGDTLIARATRCGVTYA